MTVADHRRRGDEVLHPACTDCVHYHVTWDPSAPHGCSAFGFKSPRQPARVVYETSGAVCALFSRPANARKGR